MQQYSPVLPFSPFLLADESPLTQQNLVPLDKLNVPLIRNRGAKLKVRLGYKTAIPGRPLSPSFRFGTKCSYLSSRPIRFDKRRRAFEASERGYNPTSSKEICYTLAEFLRRHSQTGKPCLKTGATDLARSDRRSHRRSFACVGRRPGRHVLQMAVWQQPPETIKDRSS